MAENLELDLSGFINKINTTAESIAKGARTGMHDVLDDWKRESTDLAPMDKGTIRRSIDTEIEGDGLDLEGSITANATEKWGDGRFNYAYYIHEVKGDIKNPTTPGTIAKFLDKPAEDNEKRWQKMIENAIEEKIKKEGW